MIRVLLALLLGWLSTTATDVVRVDARGIGTVHVGTHRLTRQESTPVALGVLLPFAAASPTWTLVNHVSAGSADSATVTTGAIDTTGARLLVALIVYNDATGFTSFTDSYGNGWTAIGAAEDNTGKGQLYYVSAPIVGAGHTFNVTCPATGQPSICVLAFSATPKNAAIALDQNAAHSDGFAVGLTHQAGSVPPTRNYELTVSAQFALAAISSIDSGFSLVENVGFIGGVHFAAAIAWNTQKARAATNPTWTNATSNQATVFTATFRI